MQKLAAGVYRFQVNCLAVQNVRHAVSVVSDIHNHYPLPRIFVLIRMYIIGQNAILGYLNDNVFKRYPSFTKQPFVLFLIIFECHDLIYIECAHFVNISGYCCKDNAEKWHHSSSNLFSSNRRVAAFSLTVFILVSLNPSGLWASILRCSRTSAPVPVRCTNTSSII